MEKFKTIEELKKINQWPTLHNSAYGLLPYIRRLKGDIVVGVEIGTERGESAYLILDECPNVSKLYTIDPYEEYENWNGVISQDVLDASYEIAQENLSTFEDRCEIVKHHSATALDSYGFDAESVDFVFIDGSVDHEDYLYDLTGWYDILKPGGLFAGHNYQLQSVRDALEIFRANRNVRVPINRTDNMTYFWKKV